MIEGVADNELPTISSIENLQFLYDRKRELESSATSIEKQADIKEREKLVARERELKAKKWMSEQRDAILKDVNRQKEIKLLEKAKRLTSTTALSNKKSSLANFLVTDAFISRFKSELSKLSAHQIPVKLEKTRTEKGKVWHQVNLENSVINHKAGDILSEGEFRIVSLAAFIADILGHNGSTPVVFDDPISSLDQDFEEATTKRLVQLAKSNQTIVFTHRLSMLALFELYAKKENVDLEVVAIGREGSRIGVPRDAPSEIKKPKKVLNRYAGERLARLRKKLKNEGWDAYKVEAKSFCSDIRILIERMVENDLLADVVQRFRRDIMTKGKIMKLSKITLEDCKFIDDMMTKFSQYEHSQSNETPVPIPDPDTLGEELVKLKEWLSRFENRQIPSAT